MKKRLLIIILAALFVIPAANVQAQYRKKKETTEIIREGNNKRLWLRSKADTNWKPTPGGLYEQVTLADASKKGKKTEPIIDLGGKHKVREAAYDTVWKYTAFDGKKLYYVNYNYNNFRTVKWQKDDKRDWGTFDPVMDYISTAGRIPMHICAIFAVNPTITDQDLRDELVARAQMEALISLDYFRDILIEKEMKNKVSYKVAEIDWRYWKDAFYFTEPQPDDEVIRVGLICDFSSKKVDLLPSPAKDARNFAEIKFFANDATIQASYIPEIESLVEYLNQESGLEVLLTGYCDNVGTETYNMGLSRQRCVEIKKALMKRGIAENRIEIIAKGEDDPVGDNNTLSGRMANNRVKIQIQ
ncbi:MAG: OmpA family protein [Bacteroidales bacterium]|nr:OmpA family protein [Candidatus Colimorpha merdihippi]MCQ2281577.1 OmpA family protein [Bacteroidales bacterium]